eukprot:351042-Chlamydomonas_euryale.AAC.4
MEYSNTWAAVSSPDNKLQVRGLSQSMREDPRLTDTCAHGTSPHAACFHKGLLANKSARRAVLAAGHLPCVLDASHTKGLGKTLGDQVPLNGKLGGVGGTRAGVEQPCPTHGRCYHCTRIETSINSGSTGKPDTTLPTTRIIRV